jgi:CheY-like chemotaxis protein
MLDRTENQETILVVEDDVLVRMPISQYLRDCGYKVIEATNAEEAKTILSHKETVINLILWRNGCSPTPLTKRIRFSEFLVCLPTAPALPR